MNKLRCCGLVAMVFTGVLSGAICCAQVTPDTGSPGFAPSSAGTAVAAAEDTFSNGGVDQPTQFAAALDGTGLIALDSNAPDRLMFGATLSGGWDSNPDIVTGGVSSRFYTASPYLAIQVNAPRSQYLLQYQVTTTGYNSSYDRQVLNVASARIIQHPTERWNLDFQAMGSYGPDAARFLGPQQTVAVGEVPGTGPNSASYLTNAGNVTYLSGSLTSTLRLSARNSLLLQGSNALNRYAGYVGSNSIATADISFARDLSPTLGASIYAQNSYYYGSLRCESYGVGVGLQWKTGAKTSVALSGGPQLDTPECGVQQGFSYSISFSTSLSGKSQMYLLSARQPAVSYLGPGLWQESISTGYQRQVARPGAVSFDIGYVRSDAAAAVYSYKAAYFDCAYTYALGHGLRGSYTYRGYIGGAGGTYITRNLVLFSLDWTPGRGVSFIR